MSDARATMPAVIGAGVLGAAASLSLHTMPLLVAAVASEGRLSVAAAGLVASAYTGGQLLAVLGLPALRFRSLGLVGGGAAVTLLLAAIALSAPTMGPAFVACWFAIGCACGALQFLATTAAVAAADRQRALSIRLGITLLLCGLAITGFWIGDSFVAYTALIVPFAAAAAVFCAVGLALYRGPALPLEPPLQEPRMARAGWMGLAMMFAFFVGLTGYWAYAGHNLRQAGVALQDFALIIAISKIVSGTYLVLGSTRPTRDPLRHEGLLLPGLLSAAAMLGLAWSTSFAEVLVCMLVWQLNLNPLSARSQALAVRTQPTLLGAWLTAAMMSGSALGPVLHGLAISHSLAPVFVAYACASALLPFLLWQQMRFSPSDAPAPRDISRP